MIRENRLGKMGLWLFGLVCASAIAGSYAYLYFTPLSVIRLLAPALLAFCLFLPKAKYDRTYRYTIAFYLIYTLHTALISIYYSAYIEMVSVLNYVLGMCLVCGVLTMVYSNPRRYFRLFYRFCLGALLLLIGMAWVERLTGWHLPGCACMAEGFVGEGMPSGFWYNPNDFAAVIAMLLLFVVAYARNVLSQSKWAIPLLIVISAATLLMLKCRIALAVVVVFAFYSYRGLVRRYLKWWLLAACLAVVGLGIFVFAKGMSSGFVRLNLYKQTFASLYASWFLGFGAKMELAYYTWVNNSTMLHHNINAHSFLFEMLISSGLLVFLLYIALLCHLQKQIRRSGINEFYLLIPAYIILLFAPSSSVNLWIQYVFFAVMVGYIPFSKSLEKKEVDG